VLDQAFILSSSVFERDDAVNVVDNTIVVTNAVRARKQTNKQN